MNETNADVKGYALGALEVAFGEVETNDCKCPNCGITHGCDQSARIDELERRVEELTEDAVNTQRVLDDTLVSNGKRIATAETQVSQLRAQVETLTKERDEARMDAESKRQVTAIALEEHEKLRAAIRAARAQEEQP